MLAAGEALAPMNVAGGVFAQGEKQKAEALLGFREVGVCRQRGLIVLARFRERPVLEQQVGEVDPGRRRIRMMGDRLAIAAQGRAAMTALERQAAEVGEGAEMTFVAAKDVEVSRLGLVIAAEGGEQAPRARTARSRSSG